MWWYTPIIPALRRQMQKDQEFDTSLGYPCEFKASLVYTVRLPQKRSKFYVIHVLLLKERRRERNIMVFFPFLRTWKFSATNQAPKCPLFLKVETL